MLGQGFLSLHRSNRFSNKWFSNNNLLKSSKNKLLRLSNLRRKVKRRKRRRKVDPLQVALLAAAPVSQVTMKKKL